MHYTAIDYRSPAISLTMIEEKTGTKDTTILLLRSLLSHRSIRSQTSISPVSCRPFYLRAKSTGRACRSKKKTRTIRIRRILCTSLSRQSRFVACEYQVIPFIIVPHDMSVIQAHPSSARSTSFPVSVVRSTASSRPHYSSFFFSSAAAFSAKSSSLRSSSTGAIWAMNLFAHVERRKETGSDRGQSLSLGCSTRARRGSKASKRTNSCYRTSARSSRSRRSRADSSTSTRSSQKERRRAKRRWCSSQRRDRGSCLAQRQR